ncbi:MAG: hypothetical protein ACK4MF_02135 [Hyphomicrobiaceae bacterium]
MSSLSVESVGDGEAVIRVRGLTELPSTTTFRIEPIDEDAIPASASGWPHGEIAAVSARVGADGVELVIPQDVVDAPLLLPGTPVVLSVPGADARQELRWPKLTVPTVRRRSATVLTGEQRAAEIAARAEQQRAELARIRAARIAAEKEQEEAALALLDARRMAPSDGVAGSPPRLRDGDEYAAASAGSARSDALSSLGGFGQPAATAAAAAAALAAGSLPPLGGIPGHGGALRGGPPPIPTGVDPEADTLVIGPAPTHGAPPPLPAATERPAKDDDHEPVDPRTAKEVLARQMATRELPTNNAGARAPLAFGLGFLVAGGLAALASYSSGWGDPRGGPDDLVAELRGEAAGLRQRLADEMEARRVAAQAAERTSALADEVKKLEERLANADAIEAELARLRSELSGTGDRIKALSDAKESAETAAGALKQQLEQVEAARLQAEAEAQRLTRELEQVRMAASDTPSRRQARDGVRSPSASVEQAAVAAPAVVPAAADTSITLRVIGSEFEISGRLESYDGKWYVIVAPNVGSMTFAADRVQCQGPGCPR